jgi:DNA invertase Pin-like site-specific DNA recombinase
MRQIIGIITPNDDDPDGSIQKKQMASAGCSSVFYRQDISAYVFRASVFYEAQSGDALLACRLENFGHSNVELASFVRKAFERDLHIVTLDGAIDSRVPSIRRAIDAFLVTSKLYNSQRIRNNLAAAREKGAPLGRKRLFTESDWPRIYNKLLIKSMNAVAKEEGVSRTTLKAFYDRMTGT